MSSILSHLPNGLAVLEDGSLVDENRYDQRYARGHEPAPTNGKDLRTETERDRARIGYSPFLRRLAGVTQVMSPELTSSHLHTRASHSYKVAMVAREIAEHLVREARRDSALADFILRMGGLDVTACEAAGLAHDLGHPPFGHIGEETLDRLLVKRIPEGFEGNAQSFRIVTKLDQHKPTFKGLNLTNVTLAAILKYPWGRDLAKTGSQKFNIYASEDADFTRAREAVIPGGDPVGDGDGDGDGDDQRPSQTLEASIMDLADDVAYSIHDLEDFFTHGIVDIPRTLEALNQAAQHYKSNGEVSDDNPFVVVEEKLKRSSQFNRGDYGTALTFVRNKFNLISTPEASPSAELYRLELKAALNSLVAGYFGELEYGDFDDGHRVRLKATQWHRMQVLKSITRQYLVLTPKMGVMQQSQAVAIKQLFKGLERWLLALDSWGPLPETFVVILEDLGAARPQAEKPLRRLDPAHYRAICDYICQMSDSEALRQSQWLSGTEVPGMSAIALTR
ncbi:deoxyguanosinetriphosphate triphosphohydrolase family protein [Leifsonia aquatica]|uniref:deoxyguanosinetriphosphate triphosphohydrolase family protein n=1 Tax=Leifsonia aquatica TaxID=144185 RepID=UPI00381C5EFE